MPQLLTVYPRITSALLSPVLFLIKFLVLYCGFHYRDIVQPLRHRGYCLKLSFFPSLVHLLFSFHFLISVKLQSRVCFKLPIQSKCIFNRIYPSTSMFLHLFRALFPRFSKNIRIHVYAFIICSFHANHRQHELKLSLFHSISI